MNIKKNIEPFIFLSSSLLVFSLVFLSFIDIEKLDALLNLLRNQAIDKFSSLFIIGVTFLVSYALFLIVSRYGSIRLGGENEKTEYSVFSWFSMLFSAGMGIGLVFYGIAEPIYHFNAPLESDPKTVEAVTEALRISIFHWGLSAWAVYAVLAAALAFAHFNLGLPLAIRSTLKPLLKDNYDKVPGKAIEVLAVLATLFGLATSLGLGASQINSGLNYIFGIEFSNTQQVIIVLFITLCAGISLLVGLDKGIKSLSQANILAALALMLFVLIAGPTTELLHSIPENTFSYARHFVSMSFFNDAHQEESWSKSWTIFYWAWWISWSPFVAIFIARISKGRTLREFVLGVVLAPTLVAIFWFSIFGGAALHQELYANGSISTAVNENVSTALFSFLENYPLSELSSLLAIVVIGVFFISSSDSGSYVIDTLTSKGEEQPQAWKKIYWVSLEGLVAILLISAGGLSALQAGAVATGLPFLIVLILVAFSFQRSLAAYLYPPETSEVKDDN